jgi:hypothetical protein
MTPYVAGLGLSGSRKLLNDLSKFVITVGRTGEIVVGGERHLMIVVGLMGVDLDGEVDSAVNAPCGLDGLLGLRGKKRLRCSSRAV